MQQQTVSVKTHDLSRHALDWAVAKCLGKDLAQLTDFSPSYNWCQAGPIIEEAYISIGFARYAPLDSAVWDAIIPHKNSYILEYGSTPLVAAMRAYVSCKLGNMVEVPEELL